MAALRKLATYVHVHDKDGQSHAFGPDDQLPAWARKAITNDAVWADGGAEESDEESDASDAETK